MNEYLGAKQIIQLCIDQKSPGGPLHPSDRVTCISLKTSERNHGSKVAHLSQDHPNQPILTASPSSAQRVCFPSPTFLWTYFLCTARNYLFSVTKRKFRGEKRGRDRRRERVRVPTDQFLVFGRVGSYEVRTPVQPEQKKHQT